MQPKADHTPPWPELFPSEADTHAYITNVQSDLQKHKPHLTGFFYNAVMYLKELTPLTKSALDSIRKLALASEHLYIDTYALLPCSVQKGELAQFTDIVFALSKLSTKSARVIIHCYPVLSFPIDDIALEILYLVERCLANTVSAHKALSFCLSFQNPEQSRFLLRQFEILAAHTPGIIEELLAQLGQKGILLSPVTFFSWFARATDLITSNRVEEGVQFLRMRSQESRRLLKLNDVVLDDLKSVLKIYCTSLAGNDIEIVNLEHSGFGFSSPYTDGKSIFLPPAIHHFNNVQANERVYTALSALPAATISNGTFAFDLASIDFQDELNERYGLLLPEIIANVRKQYRDTAQSVRETTEGDIEVIFSAGRKLFVVDTEHEKYFYSFPIPEFVRELFALVESARIEHILSLKYAGLKEDFLVLNFFLFERRPSFHQE